MNKRQAENWNRVQDALMTLGIHRADVDALFRIEKTLARWSEHECNGNIQRDGDAGDGKPRWYYGFDGPGPTRSYPIPDRERGALKRLDKIMAKYPTLFAYNQGDPRGCSLYILKKSDHPADKQAHGCDVNYTRGIAVCV